MIKTNKLKNYILYLNIVSLILILIAEICFYTKDNAIIYRIMTFVGISISFSANFKKNNYKISKFFVWVSIIYLLFIIYGMFFLRKGTFQLYTVIFRYIEVISIYNSLKQIIKDKSCKIYIPFVISGTFSAIYLFLLEKMNFLSGNMRIGDSLSGNVNTVGFNMGIISVIVMWWYCQEKKLYKLLLFLLFVFIMLVTGSKKAFIILIFDFVILFLSSKNSIAKWCKLLFAFCILFYIVFNVPYFYDIIGIRIESMIGILTNVNSITYSYSTDIRKIMINEGLSFFFQNPILGGGWNYFYYRTSTIFEYSHNNYVELLCNFGIIGFIIYYSRYIKNLFFTLKRIKNKKSKYYDMIVVAFVLVILALILDYGAVVFSAQCVWYLPVIISTVLIEKILNNERNELYEQNKDVNEITEKRQITN